MYQESNTAHHSKCTIATPWTLANVLLFFQLHLNILDRKALSSLVLVAMGSQLFRASVKPVENCAHSALFYTLPHLATYSLFHVPHWGIKPRHTLGRCSSIV